MTPPRPVGQSSCPASSSPDSNSSRWSTCPWACASHTDTPPRSAWTPSRPSGCARRPPAGSAGSSPRPRATRSTRPATTARGSPRSSARSTRTSGSVPPDVLLRMLLFQLRAFVNAGFRAVVVLTGHHGNEADLRLVATEVMRTRPVRIITVSDPELARPRLHRRSRRPLRDSRSSCTSGPTSSTSPGSATQPPARWAGSPRETTPPRPPRSTGRAHPRTQPHPDSHHLIDLPPAVPPNRSSR